MKPQRMAFGLVGIAAMMLSLSFAAVPFYDWFCRVTGFGGTTSVASVSPDLILDQVVKIRFDASLDAGMPWEFRPEVPSMDLRIGETGLAFYEAYNPTDRVVAGTASYNVTPYQAGGYFNKIECFCFTEQVLKPGERVLMPVTFFVDPEMLKNIEARDIPEITLSYTFYETELTEQQKQAMLETAPATPIN